MRSLPLGRHEHEGPSQGRRAPKPEGGHRRPQRETGRQTRESPLPSGLGHHAHYRLLQYYLPLDLPIGSPTTHQATACTAHGTEPHPTAVRPGLDGPDHPRLSCPWSVWPGREHHRRRGRAPGRDASRAVRHDGRRPASPFSRSPRQATDET